MTYVLNTKTKGKYYEVNILKKTSKLKLFLILWSFQCHATANEVTDIFLFFFFPVPR